MKLIIDIPEETYNDIQSRDWKNGEFIFSEEWRAIHNGTPFPDNATRAQVFEKIFGMKIDTTGDCGFFDCSDISSCHDCRVGQMKPLRDAYKIWWDAPYKGGE